MRIDHFELMVLSAILVCPTFAATAHDAPRDARAAVHDTAASAEPEVEIPFANFNIYDWAANGEHGIYIETLGRKWYYAKLFAPCINLPFALRVGFVTEPGSGQFDRFSSILVQGQQCPVQSLTKSGPPPSKAKRWRSRHGTSEGAGHGGNSASGASR